ncbi:MAG: hypothetical protein JO159_07065 [Acidobacteria bacterium]|nr:hypothetical protein [Acidobacteriota bacterium]MBV9623521.1 hypothetical protein [Acidobacteriota bacterium]
MLRLYRSLLWLYPARSRQEFAEEMDSVMRLAEGEVRKKNFRVRLAFVLREFAGLVAGAIREHLRSVSGLYGQNPFGRFEMRPQFRFPRSTISLMIVILAGVILAIENAKSVQVKYGEAAHVTVGSTFPGFFAVGFSIIFVAAVIGWAILFALRRSGVHRLSELRTWPDGR